ncbi:transposase [Streptomyces sp. NPDC049744]|uniref:transposase n=1 Tax=Streptomyces sp. NPDC049744 TaxID=3154359 RepID=UPI00343D7684
MPDRKALCQSLFVLRTRIHWEGLLQELGFSSGMTCWRRLAAWCEAGVWDRVHQLLLNELRSRNQLGWERAVIDTLPVRPGCLTGRESGPRPVDRARPGSKRHLTVDGQAIPLAVSLTGGNRNDVTQLEAPLDKSFGCSSTAES